MIQLEDPSLLRTHAYLGGQWVDAAGGATLPVVDPATGQQVATVPAMGEGETQRALGAADAAWPAWRARTAKDRAAVLRRWFELMLAHHQHIQSSPRKARKLCKCKASGLFHIHRSSD
jgi:succinate-semialdehyde dehydrogenase/glutarate-semialdehyde dehydrogenase